MNSSHCVGILTPLLPIVNPKVPRVYQHQLEGYNSMLECHILILASFIILRHVRQSLKVPTAGKVCLR